MYDQKLPKFGPIFDLLKTSVMQKIKDILWLVSEESWWRTDEDELTNLPKVNGSKNNLETSFYKPQKTQIYF